MNVYVFRPAGYRYRPSGGWEIFAAAGHDLTQGELIDPQSQRNFHYLVEPGDTWQYVLDVRNIHVDAADISVPPRYAQQMKLDQDLPWQVAVKLVVMADDCLRFEEQDRVVPFGMTISQGAHWGATLDVTGSDGQPLPPPGSVQIRRQTASNQPAGTYTAPGITFSQTFTVPFAGDIVGLVPHLHTGAAELQLQDAMGKTLVSWRPQLSPKKHPGHIEGYNHEIWPTNPIHVGKGSSLKVAVAYSTESTTRDDERAAGNPLDGKAYDYNNAFEMTDAMAIVGAAISPTP